MKVNKILLLIIIGASVCFFAFFSCNVCLANSSASRVVKLDNPLMTGANPAEIIGLIIKSALGVIGGLTLLMLVWGGFQWLTSAGNPDKVQKGSKTMLWAIIGLILTLGSYVLLIAVLGFLTGKQLG